MNLKDPVAVYTADQNVEADTVMIFLREQGIEAYASEDVTNIFAGLRGIEKQQVWVDRSDLARAKQLLAEHDHSAVAKSSGQKPLMDVVCEECGKTSQFSVDLLGSIQVCPHCGAYVDVGEVDETGAWDEGEEDEEE